MHFWVNYINWDGEIVVSILLISIFMNQTYWNDRQNQYIFLYYKHACYVYKRINLFMYECCSLCVAVVDKKSPHKDK